MAVNLHAAHFRFGNDDGSTEANHTFKANEDVNITLNADTTFLLRIIVQETGGTLASNTDFRFQCARNGGAFQDITTSSTICKAVAAASYVDAANTTKRLTGTGTFESSSAGCTEDGLAGGNANDIAANGCSETVCSIQVVGTDVAVNDSITFRLTSPDFTITNDVVPTLTVGGPATVAPGVGAVTVTGFVPTISAPMNVTTDVGAVTITGFVPTISAPMNVTPDVGAVTVTGFVPTISAPMNVTPGLGELTVTGFAPEWSAGAPANVDPGVGQLTVTGFAPTIPLIVTPGLGEITVAGFAPTISAPANIETATGQATVAGFAPTISAPANIETATGQLTVNGFAPTVSAPMDVTPGVGELTIIGFAPPFSSGAPVNVFPGVGELIIEGFAPDIHSINDSLPVVMTPGGGGGGWGGHVPGPTIPELLKRKRRGKKSKLKIEQLLAMILED